jgi:thiamine-phosphate pyrophosphorylase
MSPLYAIVDVDVCLAAGLTPESASAAFLRAGVSHLQIRAKHLASGAFLELVTAILPAARAAGATLLVNDRVDVARSAGVGVHLGQEDLPVAEARRILGPEAVIGRSTHTAAELAAALAESVTYVAYGPVFATRTKANPDPVVGLDGIRAAAVEAGAAGLPLVAIGGITLSTARSVTEAGANAVAVISDLLADPADPEARARRFLWALAAKPV